MAHLKSSIKKNLSDQDMLKGYEEDSKRSQSVKPKALRPDKNNPTSYMTPELFDALNDALLKLKLDLYKEGIVNYDVKIKYNNKQIVLTAKYKSN